MAPPRKKKKRPAVADAIRAARQAAGLTQQALADAAGLTQGHVAKFESGRNCPPLRTLRRLAEALGVTAAALVGE
jgi:transcriptional regulator with XRE-family HTH domain